jgi:hypothetical protein
VLLARYDQLHEARAALLQSVSVQPTAEAWHNLAVVHTRLGEADLAQRARYEHELVLRQANSPRASAVGDALQWVSPQSFAATNPPPSNAPSPPRPSTPVAQSPKAPPLERDAQRPWWQRWSEKR